MTQMTVNTETFFTHQALLTTSSMLYAQPLKDSKF